MAVTSLYVTEEPGVGLAEVDICTLEINIKYEVIPSIVCSVCLSFGLIYSFFGYRCFKMVMFFSGFMFGSAAVVLLYHKEPVLDAQLGTETKAGIGLGVGVLCGLMTMLVSTMGLILSGIQLGGLISLPILVVIGQFYSLTPVWVPLSAVVAVSVVTAVFTIQWQKLFTIIYTSVFGATAVMLCVDYLVGTFMLPDQVYDMLCQAAPRPLCWFNWVITGIFPVLSLIGVLVQWKFTGKGISHTEAAQKKQKKNTRKHRHRESRRGPQPHRRRRPPPLKRYAGDVLAPSYLQSLQEHQMGTGSSCSSVSTITHTLIDFDFETGSMVPLTAASPVFAV
ncbi:transmembrane protein 198-like isoform X1 [Thunnus albacares]|uniref:transmembrane protein 198-like isoform X1 n=1 Tax=Thunnus albacares TaxID=8236 RepID=UPI001CF70257|nr:transmembrane protein 198-like isoform X1 [Thunnus albacares]